MTELSSDFYFYKGTFGLIIGPILLVPFIHFFLVDGKSIVVEYVLYSFLIILVITRLIKWPKNRRVLLGADYLIIEKYFSDESIRVPLKDVTGLTKGFDWVKQYPMKLYDLTFIYNDVRRKVIFFKSANLSESDMTKIIGRIFQQ